MVERKLVNGIPRRFNNSPHHPQFNISSHTRPTADRTLGRVGERFMQTGQHLIDYMHVCVRLLRRSPLLLLVKYR
ncbi:hypothetical protein AK36_2458 [Burkholderia vietnamiensis LMG 10929]|nr:hypothetical protein AK36_2458 [Burkholderia vietnamiensis LMG 10929]